MLPSKYEDNTLQIKEKSTERTAPFFVLEVTARSAADILGIHPNSAALFYRKIRTVINHHLALAADEVFEGPVEPDESDFGGRRKGRRGRGAAGKVVVFGILKRNDGSIPLWWIMPSLKRYSLSSKENHAGRLFIPIV
ncbi:putative transposase [Neisseria meningitidis NM3147]|nr:putative transposase [Neisseria meningitidis NM3147]